MKLNGQTSISPIPPGTSPINKMDKYGQYGQNMDKLIFNHNPLIPMQPHHKPPLLMQGNMDNLNLKIKQPQILVEL